MQHSAFFFFFFTLICLNPAVYLHDALHAVDDVERSGKLQVKRNWLIVDILGVDRLDMEVETNVIVEDDLLARNNPSAHYSDLVDADDGLQSERNADNSVVAGKAHALARGNRWTMASIW